ncbi:MULTISPECIES: methylenetetrahydrofolate reductase [NAD(P)H] [Calditerrivibrio]|uniref:Methylenetetrahydrofolate reductase n=1 Tax=Calditerrivibrio nitroreducens TaxID=477976 RepID=A0A2J6WJN7_9BACT|nr:MAG: methylenetetrahydrofolate reductase [NAD(P)H] [Calditerrivibrio nitroreducens]
MKICDKLNIKKRVLSFEFFPPKKVENEHILFETLDELTNFNPDFVSITYGAGGSTKDKTLEWTLKIKNDYKLTVMMHLTCITSDKEEIDELLDNLKKNGIENILALRGDIPKDGLNYHISNDFKYASDLVSFIKQKDFCIGVAGYPEGHLEANSIEEDILNLKKKIEAGGDFIITQLFFDNRLFYKYLELLAKNDINTHVLAGIMPITSFAQVDKFKKMCGVYIPEEFINRITDKDDDYVFNAGLEYTIKQCEDLLSNGVKGLHFYTLNRSEATKKILNNLKYEV